MISHILPTKERNKPKLNGTKNLDSLPVHTL